MTGLIAKDWIGAVDREYLSDFILDGGGSVRFLVGSPDENAEVSAALDALAETKGFNRVDLDAARIRLHRIDHVFFEIARQIDWDSLAAVYIAEALREPGWTLARPGNAFDLAAMAAENGIDETGIRQTLKASLADLYGDYYMTQEFRLALIQICRAQIAGLENFAAPAIAWLRGELPRISELKGAKIFQKIGRHNARLMLQSLAHWLRRNSPCKRASRMERSKGFAR